MTIISMKKLLLIIAVAFQVTLYAQENGFLFTSEQYEQYSGTCAIETEDNCYIVCTWAETEYYSERPSMLLKLSREGMLLESVPLGDSYSFVVRLHGETGSSVYYAIGIHWDPQTERLYPFIASFDKDLNIIDMKDVTDIPETYTFPVWDAAAVVNNNGKVLFVYEYSSSELHYMVLNLDGVLENYKAVNVSGGGFVGSLCLFQDGSGDFGHYESHVTTRMLRIDEQLDMEPVFDIWQVQESQWNASDTIHRVYVGPSPYPTVLSLSDSSFVFAEETTEVWFDHYHSQPFFWDNNTVFFKCDNNGEIGNSILIDTRNDTLERPAYLQAVDRSESNSIYLCSFQHLLHNSWGPLINQNHIILMKTDLDLNLIWERRYTFGDACNRPYHILSTSDGGCLITGGIRIKDANRSDLFVLKLNADGTLGTSCFGVTAYPFRFFPNPVEGTLNMEYSPDVTPKALEIYDLQGRLLRTQHSNFGQVGMEDLPAGTYTMRIVMTDGTAYSEKVIKQ